MGYIFDGLTPTVWTWLPLGLYVVWSGFRRAYIVTRFGNPIDLAVIEGFYSWMQGESPSDLEGDLIELQRELEEVEAEADRAEQRAKIAQEQVRQAKELRDRPKRMRDARRKRQRLRKEAQRRQQEARATESREARARKKAAQEVEQAREAERRLALEQERRIAQLKSRAAHIAQDPRVALLIQQGQLDAAESLIAQAEQIEVFRAEAEEVGCVSKVLGHLDRGDTEAAQEAIRSVRAQRAREERERREAERHRDFFGEIRTRMDEVDDQVRGELEAQVAILRAAEPGSRQYRKALYAIERELGSLTG